MNKITIGERLYKLRKELNYTSQADFANFLNVNQTTVSKYEKNTTDIPDSLKIRLSEKGVNLHWLLTGEGEMFLSNEEKLPVNPRVGVPIVESVGENGFVIPLLDQSLSAGNGQYLPDADSVTGYIAVPRELARYGKKLAVLNVQGDSMEPTLSRGDMIVCDSCGWDGEGIYAIHVNGQGFVKRLSAKPGKIVVISDNPKYETYEEPFESDAIRVVGRVHCVVKNVK